jgi:hypothetical protein
MYIWDCYFYLCLDSTVNEICTYNNNDKNNIFNIAIIMRENTPTKKALRLKDSLRKRESRAKEETSNLQNQKNSHRNDNQCLFSWSK